MSEQTPAAADDAGGLARASRGLSGVAALALAVMTIWTVVDVATRYLLSKPLRGSIDLVEATLVLVVFLSLPDCFRRGEQITVDVLDHLCGARTIAALKTLASVATLVFLVLLFVTGIQPALDAARFGDHKPDLPIPIAALLAVIELALAVSIVIVAAQLVGRLRQASRRDRSAR